MNNQAFELLIDKIDKVEEDVKDMDKRLTRKIDSILEWKFKIIGGQIAVGIFFSLIFQVIIAIMQK